jgi:hypothetical protein
MANLKHQWIVLEAIDQVEQVRTFLVRIFERPGKLQEQRAQLSGCGQRFDTVAEFLFIRCRCLPAFMREHSMELGGEDEILIGNHAADPGIGCLRSWRPVEGAVDLDVSKKPAR